jgi:hypothetical protein
MLWVACQVGEEVLGVRDWGDKEGGEDWEGGEDKNNTPHSTPHTSYPTPNTQHPCPYVPQAPPTSPAPPLPACHRL